MHQELRTEQLVGLYLLQLKFLKNIITECRQKYNFEWHCYNLNMRVEIIEELFINCPHSKKSDRMVIDRS